jgi:hypothetical protein
VTGVQTCALPISRTFLLGHPVYNVKYSRHVLVLYTVYFPKKEITSAKSTYLSNV